MLLSIIIPYYNFARFISKNLDMLITQGLDDCEIIVVNNSSTDSSGKMCDFFALKDYRIKVVHKQNGVLKEVS